MPSKSLTRIAAFVATLGLSVSPSLAQFSIDEMVEYRTTLAADVIPGCQIALSASGPATAAEGVMVGECLGAARTYMNSFAMLTEHYEFCPPLDLTLRNVVEVVVGFTDTHPDQLETFYPHVAYAAFVEAWPC